MLSKAALIGLGTVWFSCLSIVGAAEGPAADRLPFSSEETTGTLEIIVRHRMTWNRATGELRWDRLEMEAPGLAKLEVAPGAFRPWDDVDERLNLQLEVRDGYLDTELALRENGTWAAPIRASLGPRDLQWKDPRVFIQQVSVKGHLGIDTAVRDGPLEGLMTLDLRPLKIQLLQAGDYEASEVQILGAWRRPAWDLDFFEARTFGGIVRARGRGSWGTREHPAVSLELEAEGIDLHALLKAFHVARADDVRARVRGRARLEAEGRDWKLLELDLIGEEGTVSLSRKLLYDILSPSLTEVLTRKQIDDALNSAFGRRQMIPFEELNFEGQLTPRSLNLRLPLRNEVLSLDIEPQIDKELLWDIWDEVVAAGMENVRGLQTPERTGPPGTGRTR